MDFPGGASEKLDKLIAFYSEKFKIEYNIEIDGTVIPVMASMRDRQQKSVFGFAMKGLGPEACEYVFFLQEPSFNSDVAAKIDGIFSAAEKEYVHPGRDHAFTFLSAVVFAENIEEDSKDKLKRYKLRRDYRENGWLVARTVVLGQDEEAYFSKDGSDLKRLLQKVIVTS